MLKKSCRPVFGYGAFSAKFLLKFENSAMPINIGNALTEDFVVQFLNIVYLSRFFGWLCKSSSSGKLRNLLFLLRYYLLGFEKNVVRVRVPFLMSWLI